MKTIVICLLAWATASRQNYLTVTTRQGADVHVQGNRMDVMDSRSTGATTSKMLINK